MGIKNVIKKIGGKAGDKVAQLFRHLEKNIC